MDGKKKWSWKLPQGVPKLRKDQILILFLAGVLLLVIALPHDSGKKETDSSRTGTEAGEDASAGADDYAGYMERHLEETLSQLAGAGEVKVMITLKSSTERVVEKDVETADESVTESDSQGGSRSTHNKTKGEATVYEGEGSQSQNPYVSKELSPEVQGVVVLASGGDDPLVVENITDAVQALFGIDTHKIRIMKKN